jgi:adenylyltransferase/sulfurtransferase
VSLREDQVRRYARHVLLPDMGGRGQSRLLAGAVSVAVGPGDAAAVAALAYLAAAGVGTIVLSGEPQSSPSPGDIAHGIVYGTADQQRTRFEAIRERLEAINGDVTVTCEAVPGAVAVAPEPAADVAAALINGGTAAARAVAHISGSA